MALALSQSAQSSPVSADYISAQLSRYLATIKSAVKLARVSWLKDGTRAPI